MRYRILPQFTFIAALLLSGCSFGSGRVADSLKIARTDRHSNWSIERISESPNVYRRSDPTEQGYSLFMTGIKECPIKEGRSSVATTRSLLVGLTDLRLRRQEEVSLNGAPALLSIIEAHFDGRPIALALYTIREQDCVRDYIAWLVTKDGSEKTVKDISIELETELDALQRFIAGAMSGGFKDGANFARSISEPTAGGG